MRNLLTALLIGFLFMACNSSSSSKSEMETLEAALNADPSPANANNLIKEINKQISASSKGLESNKALLVKGLNIAREHKLTNRVAGFLASLLRINDGSSERAGQILELAGIMKASKKDNAAMTLYKSFADQFPNDPNAAAAKQNLGALANQDIHVYLKTLAESIFENPNQFGINEASSLQYVDACEAYALGYNDERAPEYLYKAAEIARSLRTFPKTLGLYDWIVDRYPNYEKTPTTLFLKGFVLENELKNTEMARASYEQFLSSYPSHELADDVTFLLENLGKSNDEILEIIEKNKKEKQAQ